MGVDVTTLPTAPNLSAQAASPVRSRRERQLDDERRGGLVGESDRASVPFDDVACDRQSQSRASRVASPRFVEPSEAFEHLSPLVPGIPTPSSLTVRRASPSISASVIVTVVEA